MKILVTINYHKQRAAPCQLLCLPKTNLAQLRVEVDQTGGSPVVLVNPSQVCEVLEVYHIGICFPFVHKHGRVKQEQEVTPQCAM